MVNVECTRALVMIFQACIWSPMAFGVHGWVEIGSRPRRLMAEILHDVCWNIYVSGLSLNDSQQSVPTKELLTMLAAVLAPGLSDLMPKWLPASHSLPTQDWVHCTHHHPVCSSTSATSPILQMPLELTASTVTMTMHPQFTETTPAHCVWLQGESYQLSPFLSFMFIFFTLSVGFNSHFRLLLDLEEPLPSFLSSPQCYIAASELCLSERFFTLLLTVQLSSPIF